MLDLLKTKGKKMLSRDQVRSIEETIGGRDVALRRIVNKYNLQGGFGMREMFRLRPRVEVRSISTSRSQRRWMLLKISSSWSAIRKCSNMAKSKQL